MSVVSTCPSMRGKGTCGAPGAGSCTAICQSCATPMRYAQMIPISSRQIFRNSPTEVITHKTRMLPTKYFYFSITLLFRLLPVGAGRGWVATERSLGVDSEPCNTTSVNSNHLNRMQRSINHQQSYTKLNFNNYPFNLNTQCLSDCLWIVLNSSVSWNIEQEKPFSINHNQVVVWQTFLPAKIN